MLRRREKEEETSGGSPAWMATFSDLMNLLLCFFVLLFAFSSVDEAKYNELIDSLSSTFSIFSKSGSSFLEGELIDLGTAQLSELDKYFANMGEIAEGSGGTIQSYVEMITKESEEKVADIVSGLNEEETKKMFDKLSDLSSRYDLDNDLSAAIDEDGFRYVEIIIQGSVLFESGSAQLKENILPTFSRVADILKRFPKHRIAIIGHTDNVPMNKSNKYESNMELSSARAISAAKYLVDEKGMDRGLLEWVGRGEYDPIAGNDTTEGRAKNRRIEIRIYNTLNSN